VSFFISHKGPVPIKPTPNPYPSRVQGWKKHLTLSFFLLMLGGLGLFRFYKPVYDICQQEFFEKAALLQGAFLRPFQETNALLKENQSFMHLKQDHARLEQENEALKWKIQALEPLAHENVALKQNLNIPSFAAYERLTVRVLASPYDGFHHFFLVAAGKEDGLAKDQAVVTPDGIVGRIERVGQKIARILLINDINSRIPVMTEVSQQRAILAGEGTAFPTLVYLDDSKRIQRGEKVVTSGLGGLFPPGLPVGIVEEISNGKVCVRPYASFRHIDWVHILRVNSETVAQEIETFLEGE
jgi:rod shape-determining protein MreC